MASTASGSQQSPLLRLPCEICDYIYSLSVVSPDPTIAYLDYCVTFRDTDLGGREILSHSKVYPVIPPLAQVSQQLREEVLKTFFTGDKVLYFKPCFRSQYPIAKWHSRLSWLSSHVRSIRLEFRIQESAWVRKWSLALIYICSNGRGHLDLDYGGALTAECVCQLTKGLRDYANTLPSASAVKIAIRFEKWFLPGLHQPSQKVKIPYLHKCEQCGKRNHDTE